MTAARKFSGTLNFPAPVKGGATALRRAGIDWTATAVPLNTLSPSHPGAERWVAAVRDVDNAMIGVNGTRHEIVQNDALAELGDAVIQMNAGFAYTGGGAFPHGDKTYLILTGERNIQFGGSDDLGFNAILLTNDFNGNSPVVGTGFIGRLSCTNQIAGLARGRKKGSQRLVRVAHTRSASWQLAAAKDTLRALVHEMDETEKELQEMLKVKVTVEQAITAAVGERPVDTGDNARALTTWENKRVAFKAELLSPWNEHISTTKLGAVMAAQGIDEHASRSADRDKARIDRLITANFPTMKRVLRDLVPA